MADGFLGRWSRRKQEVREGKPVQDPAPPVPQASVPAGVNAPAPLAAQPAAAPVPPEPAAPPLPTLQDAQSLSMEFIELERERCLCRKLFSIVKAQISQHVVSALRMVTTLHRLSPARLVTGQHGLQPLLDQFHVRLRRGDAGLGLLLERM